MNIGKLDRRLTLQQPTAVPQNDFGEPAPASFTDVATVACAVEYKPGSEGLLAQQLTPTQRILFVLRYRPDVRPDWQLVYEGRTFQITDVAELGRRRATVLTCYSHGVGAQPVVPVVVVPALGFPHAFPAELGQAKPAVVPSFPVALPLAFT